MLVPARDESELLPRTLPALLAHDYPGDWSVVLVDDRSTDGTGELARSFGGARLHVVAGSALPPGWAGKVWALEQAAAAAGLPDYLLLTDADIRHAPGSLRRLVAESGREGLALNSRMARLRCDAFWERLLIPPFVLFFNLLYPMPRANDPADRLAAAAGGCVLLRREALLRAGGFAAIRGAVIDDVSLARRVKALGEPIRLALSRSEVESLRRHDSLGSVWRMVQRTAFDELRYSWLRVAAAVVLIALMFPGPPVLAATGIALLEPAIAGSGVAAWALAALVYAPAVRLYGLNPLWTLTLPLAGALYCGMTVDSARRGRAVVWS